MKKDRIKEAEYKEKAGTAWSHSYLNQKPWHPLSYPNQRRKWIAEQTHAQKEERKEEVAREFAQEQEFFRQTSQMSKKEKEKMEARQAVSFLYIRPPGYNAEAARAAEIAEEKKKLGLTTSAATTTAGTNSVAVTNDGEGSTPVQEKKKSRPKDVFGRALPTEEEFPSLKDAPRHDTGVATRVKPFAIEIRNVKCARCGAFGHQSGDRECPLKDVLMPNEEARLIREDPLNVILAQTGDEGLKWELKQKPGLLSPARGGFKADDPNQQIIPDENIYDEYGGFLPGGGEEGPLSIPNLLASLSHRQRRHLTDANGERKRKRRKEHKAQKRKTKHLDRGRFDGSSDDHRYRYGGDSNSESTDDEKRRRRHEGKNSPEIKYDHERYRPGDEDVSNSCAKEQIMDRVRGKRKSVVGKDAYERWDPNTMTESPKSKSGSSDDHLWNQSAGKRRSGCVTDHRHAFQDRKSDSSAVDKKSHRQRTEFSNYMSRRKLERIDDDNCKTRHKDADRRTF